MRVSIAAVLLRESPNTGLNPAGPDPTGAGLELGRESILGDYRLAVRSRQMSLLGRREVLTGKAKFGIFGDGKEVAQLAQARAWRPGDFRSGYYRDQTLMLALDSITVEQFFAQLYADPDPEREPHSAGRQMNAHFATPLVAPERRLAERGRPLQQLGRPLADRLADAAVGGARAGVEALPRAPGGRRRALHPRRQRGRLGHHRQRQLRRGDVLGVGQRHRRAAGAGGDLDLGRRLRHLGAQRAPGHQGRPLGAALRLPAPARTSPAATTSTRCAAGTTRRSSRPTARRRRRRGASTCRRSSTSSR